MEKLVTSEFRLGIIAGGQLGKMLVLAANNWAVKTYILDKDEHCPAAEACTRFIKGDPLNEQDVYEFGRQVDMITFEIESVNVEALDRLKAEGKAVAPDPDSLRIIQDKGLQKEFYREHRIPSPAYQIFESHLDILGHVEQGLLSPPFVQKLRKGGYDGKGVLMVRSTEDLERLLPGPSVVEQMVDVRKEISVIAARNKRGEVKCYPLVEMEFNGDANLVERLVCPSTVSENVRKQAEDIALRVISELKLIGILAIEMFVDADGQVWVNESAPRPHNSGHHSIESVITSQFEQHLRAIFNFSLGSTHLKMPAVMINLLGEPGHEGDVRYEGLTECMGVEGFKLHLYGKKVTKPFRKMGHVTILAPTIEEAKRRADYVRNIIKVKSWQSQ